MCGRRMPRRLRQLDATRRARIDTRPRVSAGDVHMGCVDIHRPVPTIHQATQVDVDARRPSGPRPHFRDARAHHGPYGVQDLVDEYKTTDEEANIEIKKALMKDGAVTVAYHHWGGDEFFNEDTGAYYC